MTETILLTGVQGQVGWELNRSLQPLGTVVAVSRRELNLESPQSIREAVRKICPTLIVNAAAYTAVDKAESEPDVARSINTDAPAILAAEAKRLGAPIIHYSTDYVFDGSSPADYVESNEPAPLNVYGQTKLLGEQAVMAENDRHIIFRTSWVFGSRGNNFVRTMRRLAAQRPELRVVADQFGSPTSARLIADVTLAVLSQARSAQDPKAFWAARSGIYHLTNRGVTTWFEFATAILNDVEPAVKVHPISTAEYPLPAKRPTRSVLCTTKLEQAFGICLPTWQESLDLCKQELALSS